MDYQTELYSQLNTQINSIIAELPNFARKFFIHKKNSGLAQRTRLQYAYDIKRFCDWLRTSPGFKDVNLNSCTASDVLDKLTMDDIQEYFDIFQDYPTISKSGKSVGQIVDAPYSAATKARKICSLRAFYKFYYQIHEIENDLSNLMEVPRIPKKETLSIMDKDQVARLLAAVTSTDGLTPGAIQRKEKTMKRDFAILMLFFGTGIRISELVGLNYDQIDFYDDSFYVTRKGGDQTIVYFGEEVEDALLDYLRTDRDILLAGNNENALFISMKHQRMGVRSIQEMIDKYAKLAGLGKTITPHTLRRTFGTNLYEETGDINLVADALHHSSVDTTRKHYVQASKEHKRLAARKASTLFHD